MFYALQIPETNFTLSITKTSGYYWGTIEVLHFYMGAISKIVLIITDFGYLTV